jgi:hypothetical protein
LVKELPSFEGKNFGGNFVSPHLDSDFNLVAFKN